MTTSEISQKAVDAATRAAFFEDHGDTSELDTMPDDMRHALDEISRASLKAAAPFLKAQALRDEADKIDTFQLGTLAAPYLSAVKAQIRAQADELEAQA